MRNLHEDKVPRSVVIIDAYPPSESGRSTIRVIGDSSMAERAGKGGSFKWEMEGIEDSTPWRMFMDWFMGVLEDSGYEPVNRDQYDVSSLEGDKRDEAMATLSKYGPLGMSAKARGKAQIKSDWEDVDDETGETIQDDLFQVNIEVAPLGTTPQECAQTLHTALAASPCPWLEFSIDDDVNTPTIYGTAEVTEPGYQTGETDFATFEPGKDTKDEAEAYAAEHGGKDIGDTDKMTPDEVKDRVRTGYEKWRKGIGKPIKKKGIETHVVGYGSIDDGGVEESNDVYACAMALLGHEPKKIIEALANRGRPTTLSEGALKMVVALRGAAPRLGKVVAEANRFLAYLFLKEDMVKRYRKALFTNQFAATFTEEFDLQDDQALRAKIVERIVAFHPSDTGQQIGHQKAVEIVNSLSDNELDTIRGNILGLK